MTEVSDLTLHQKSNVIKSFDEGLGPKRHTYFYYSLVLECFLCYSISIYWPCNLHLLTCVCVQICLPFENLILFLMTELFDPKGEFADDGTETHFSIRGHTCYIKAVSSGKRREGIVHSLIVDGQEISESME